MIKNEDFPEYSVATADSTLIQKDIINYGGLCLIYIKKY